MTLGPPKAPERLNETSATNPKTTRSLKPTFQDTNSSIFFKIFKGSQWEPDQGQEIGDPALTSSDLPSLR